MPVRNGNPERCAFFTVHFRCYDILILIPVASSEGGGTHTAHVEGDPLGTSVPDGRTHIR